VEAKQAKSDPFETIEKVINWDAFAQSIEETQQFAASESFDTFIVLAIVIRKFVITLRPF